ncbi:CsgE family curli-type amyloid fiber assembly protein [Herbaspirillum sp. GCM10030257]|uniref:CsgE family curli-type amyloid fiber assembly protein n=1 Tax=Herbaspirillum sp. GCM10030257 TaxID=3273393 RepID=UPI0036106F90
MRVQIRKGKEIKIIPRFIEAGFIFYASWFIGGVSNAAALSPSSLLESYGGIVVNQTVTVAGQEFFQCFVAAWRDRDSSDRYAISVTERPSARWGSQIWIEFAQRRVFQAPLPTARVGIRALSEQATEVVAQMVADMEVERLLFREPDLGPDEL